MNISKQIKWGALLSYISIAISILTGIFYTPWLVAAVGKSQYGLYTLTNSVISLFLVDFGLSSTTGRYLAKYHAEGNQKAAEQFLGAIYKLYLLMDVLILMIFLSVFFLMDHVFVNLTAEEMVQFRVIYAISAVFSVIHFPFVTFNGILTAYEKFIPLKIADLLYRLCNISFSVIALLMGYGLYTLVSIHAIVGLMVLVLKYVVIRKTIPVKADFKGTNKGVYREIFGFSIWVAISGFAARMVFNVTPSILGIVADSTAIAIFGVVSTIEGYVYTITTAMNGMFLPKLSRIAAVGRNENDMNSLFFNVGKFQYVLNGMIIAVFVVSGKAFIRLWMGISFVQSYEGILLVLIPGLFYNALQIANTAMVVTNRVKITAMVSLVTGLVNVSLSLPMSHRFGVTGACASIGVAYLVRDFLLGMIYHRELPLDMPGFLKECCLKMAVPILTTVACGMMLNCFVPDGDWNILMQKAAITVAIYILTTFCLALKKQEKQSVLCWLKSILAIFTGNVN